MSLGFGKKLILMVDSLSTSSICALRPQEIHGLVFTLVLSFI
jgi:hypothetical protein